MSTISLDDVKKVAELSGVILADDDLEKFRAQFEEIINYIEKLQSVDVTGLEPTYQVTGLKNVTRPDEVIDYGLSRQELLKNAPQQLNGSLKVERVL